MKDLILEFIIAEYGKNKMNHYSYCSFPEKECSYREEISYKTLLINDGFLDSFSIVTIVCFLEKKFNIKINDIDITPDNFSNIDKIYKLVKKYKIL